MRRSIFYLPLAPGKPLIMQLSEVREGMEDHSGGGAKRPFWPMLCQDFPSFVLSDAARGPGNVGGCPAYVPGQLLTPTQ